MSNFLNNPETNQYSTDEDIDGADNKSVVHGQNQTIRECVATSLTEYFSKVDHENINDLYDLVLSEMEAPLLEKVMYYTRSNQSKASNMLGLNRGTLRKKLKKYGMLN